MAARPDASIAWKVRTRSGAASLRRLDPADFVRRLRWLLAGARKRTITLTPKGSIRGRVLFSFIIEPFLVRRPDRISHAHTHDWESWQMAQTWLEQGFEVDVIRWTNRTFQPAKCYDVFIDVRLNMERLAPLLPAGCRKIMHIETAHPSVHNAAQFRRLRELKERRGIELAPFKLIEKNRAIEHADCASSLGGPFANDSYRFAGKPIHPIPISAPFTYSFPEGKDFNACRRRFLWFGSEGFVHKGLNLALEAFAGLPDLELFVCGPLEREQAFQAAFYRELHRTPNIHTQGWLDVGSRRFQDICRQCAGLVYPSCSEGCAGGVITCMHAGLIPLASYESGVELTPERGVLLPDCRVETIREQVVRLSERPPAELKERARNTWRFARERHTRESFADAYRDFVADMVKSL